MKKVFKKSDLEKAVQGYCRECCVNDKEGIKECPQKDCPLWRVRPYQEIKKKKGRLE